MRLASLFSTEPKAAPEPEKKPETPQPTYVTEDSLRASQAELTARLDALAVALTRGPATPTPTPTTAPTVTYDEVNESLRTGEKVAETIDRLVDARVSQRITKFNETEVAPLRMYGLSSLEQLAKSQALGGMPKEHKRFEKEIDAEMARMGPEMRGNPATWREAHALIVGRHLDELVNEARESAMRQASETPPESTPKVHEVDMGEGKRMRVPGLEEYVGEEGLAALDERGKGRNPDEWARAAGYEDWTDYIRVSAQYDEPIDEYPNTPLGSQTYRRGGRRPHGSH